MTRTRRQFGYIRKLPSGRYQASYQGPDGKRHTAPRTFLTKGLAGSFLAKMETKISEHGWKAQTDAPRQTTLREYAEIWLADRPLKPSTRAMYRRILDQRILPTLGSKPVASFTPLDVKAWRTSLGTEFPRAVAHAYSLLRAILGSAVDDGLLLSNPAHIRGASSAVRQHRIEIATPEQLQVITDNLPPQYGAMVWLAAWCALRFGELTELRVKDIDLGNGRVHITRAVSWVHGEFFIGSPKSAAGTRTVAIPPHILPAIRQHLNDYVNRFDQDALLFPARDGGWMEHGNFFKLWDKARKIAGRPDLRFHDLRHTGAVYAARSGATLADLMNRLGHTSAKMAINYQHASQSVDDQLAAKMSIMVTGGS